MKGLDLAYQYYMQHGKPMIREQFEAYEDQIACGLCGEGSECLGFDDSLSQDHDFGAGFCLWLTDDAYAEIGAALQRAYDALPGPFMGFPKRDICSYGDQRLGVMPISVFYTKFTGRSDVPATLAQWRIIPEEFLSIATSGRVFADALGEFTRIRDTLLAYYPEDLRLKKLANRAAKTAQAGQYNYPRCVRRGEYVAAMLALAEFVRACCSMVYLLNKKYMPFYKWAHHGIQYLPLLSDVYDKLLLLERADKEEKPDIIEEICVLLSAELHRQELTDSASDYLLDHCPGIMRRIGDEALRTSHPMSD